MVTYLFAGKYDKSKDYKLGDIVVKDGKEYMYTSNGFEPITSYDSLYEPQKENKNKIKIDTRCKYCGAPLTKINNKVKCEYCETEYN